jgi:glycosyltransferase involved in cell wall biosynthesis
MNVISLIIPCYKDSETLERALKSVFSQTYMVHEVIVVNDASPETKCIEKIMIKYKKVRYIVNKKNLGLAATRNVGVAASKGNIICFLDADDELHPQKIEIQMAFYKINIAVSCGVIVVNGNEYTTKVAVDAKDIKIAKYFKANEIICKNLLAGASLMMPKALFQQLGGYDSNLRSCEDFDLWLLILDAGVNVVHIPLPLYLYTNNPNGLSKNNFNISFWEFEVVKKYCMNKYKRINLVSSLILSIWLFKHITRYELNRDVLLKRLIVDNIEYLRPKILVFKLMRLIFWLKISKFFMTWRQVLK